MAAWHFAAHLLLLRLLLVSLIRSLNVQKCLQQSLIRLGQQECGLDDLGVAHAQPFICQVGGQFTDAHLISIV
jgi:hypothetical protein